MKTTVSINSVSYEQISWDGGRALFSAPPTEANGERVHHTMEISHLTSKNGVRRSMAKFQISTTVIATGVAHIESVHVVLTRGTNSSAAVCTNLVGKLLQGLLGVASIGVTGNTVPILPSIVSGDMTGSLVNGTFVSEAFTNANLDPT